MGMWIRDPDLLPGEEVLWRRNANREQSQLRQVGGRLFVTRRRILFVPIRLDDATGGAQWDRPLADVSAVTVQPSERAAPFFGHTARLRRRLRVELKDGSLEIFVVNRVEDAVRSLRDVITSTIGQAK
jgi:hypothetical protein